MKIRHLSAILVLTSTSAFAAGAIDELSPADQAKVKNGEQVAVFTDVAESPWPDAKIYQKIKATPEEVAAVFCDYELQASYIPSLSQSKISNVFDPATVDIDYTYVIPLGLGVENYTTKDHLSAKGDGTYRVDWSLEHADTTLQSDGDARIESLDGDAILAYHTLIVPGRTGSNLPWVVDGMKQNVQGIVGAIASQTVKEKAQDQALLSKQLKALHTALGGR